MGLPLEESNSCQDFPILFMKMYNCLFVVLSGWYTVYKCIVCWNGILLVGRYKQDARNSYNSTPLDLEQALGLSRNLSNMVDRYSNEQRMMASLQSTPGPYYNDKGTGSTVRFWTGKWRAVFQLWARRTCSTSRSSAKATWQRWATANSSSSSTNRRCSSSRKRSRCMGGSWALSCSRTTWNLPCLQPSRPRRKGNSGRKKGRLKVCIFPIMRNVNLWYLGKLYRGN